jgi:hypothetical protein
MIRFAVARSVRRRKSAVIGPAARGFIECLVAPVILILMQQAIQVNHHDASSHQRNKSAAAGDFEFAEDRMEVLFHHRQTQAGVIGDFLIRPALADKSRNFLFAPGESDKMRQTGARRPASRSSLTAQVFALDKKMRLRHAD